MSGVAPGSAPPRGLRLRLLGLLLLAVSVVAVPLALGRSVPRTHDARVEVALRSTPAEVYAKVATLEDWPRWNPYIGPMQRLGGGRYRTRPDPRSNLDYELLEARPHTLAVVRLDGRNRGLDVRWTFRLRPEGTGTHVVIEERGRIESPTARFVMHYITGYDAAAMGLVRALQRDEAPPR